MAATVAALLVSGAPVKEEVKAKAEETEALEIESDEL